MKHILFFTSLLLITSLVYSCEDDNIVDCCDTERSWYMGENAVQAGVMLDTFTFKTDASVLNISFSDASLCPAYQLHFELENNQRVIEVLNVDDYDQSYELNVNSGEEHTLYTSVILSNELINCIRLGEVQVHLSNG